MQIVVKDGQRFVVLPGALLHEEDHKQVTARSERTGEKFLDALAGYVRDLRLRPTLVVAGGRK